MKRTFLAPNGDYEVVEFEEITIWQTRIPRIVAAVVCGFVLVVGLWGLIPR